MNTYKKAYGWCRTGFWRVRRGWKAVLESIIEGNYSQSSFSQYGEDMILRAVFSRYPNSYPGFYVDIGAHHPTRFSNSRYFYKLGWSGICVDPLPTAAVMFAKQRPRDIFIQVGVAGSEGMMTYFMFDEPALNTFSEKTAEQYSSRLREKQMVHVFPLQLIFANHLPEGIAIDFLSVDVEGLDLDVLKSNDWVLYRPLIVLVEETTATTVADVENLDVVIFMKKHSYKAFARTPGGLFFVDVCSASYEDSCFLRNATI